MSTHRMKDKEKWRPISVRESDLSRTNCRWALVTQETFKYASEGWVWGSDGLGCFPPFILYTVGCRWMTKTDDADAVSCWAKWRFDFQKWIQTRWQIHPFVQWRNCPFRHLPSRNLELDPLRHIIKKAFYTNKNRRSGGTE